MHIAPILQAEYARVHAAGKQETGAVEHIDERSQRKASARARVQSASAQLLRHMFRVDFRADGGSDQDRSITGSVRQRSGEIVDVGAFVIQAHRFSQNRIEVYGDTEVDITRPCMHAFRKQACIAEHNVGVVGSLHTVFVAQNPFGLVVAYRNIRAIVQCVGKPLGEPPRYEVATDPGHCHWDATGLQFAAPNGKSGCETPVGDCEQLASANDRCRNMLRLVEDMADSRAMPMIHEGRQVSGCSGQDMFAIETELNAVFDVFLVGHANDVHALHAQKTAEHGVDGLVTKIVSMPLVDQQNATHEVFSLSDSKWSGCAAIVRGRPSCPAAMASSIAS